MWMVILKESINWLVDLLFLVLVKIIEIKVFYS